MVFLGDVIHAVLPLDFSLPIVIVQHVSSRCPSHLHKVLGYRSPFLVRQAQDGRPLRAGAVYTAPPGHYLIITPQRTLSLKDAPKINFSRPALDPLFGQGRLPQPTAETKMHSWVRQR